MSEPAIKSAEGVIGYGMWRAGIDAQPHVAGVILSTLREYGYIVTTEADLNRGIATSFNRSSARGVAVNEPKTGFDDPIGRLLLDPQPDAIFWGCQPTISFTWDQWARCRLQCQHGMWYADAGGINLSEAFEEALAVFLAGDHASSYEAWDGEE